MTAKNLSIALIHGLVLREAEAVPVPLTPIDNPDITQGHPVIVRVEVVSSDLLQIVFGHAVLNNSNLQNTSNFIITNEGDGLPITVQEVRTGIESVIDKILLVVTPFTVGEVYTLTVNSDIKDANGLSFYTYLNPITDVLTTYNSVKFTGIRTKANSLLKKPGFYDLSVNSNIRHIFNAIGLEDERIGGDKKDNFVDIAQPDGPDEISLVDASTSTDQTNANFQHHIIGDVKQGDVVIATVALNATTTGDPTGTITPPSGWVLVRRQNTSTVDPGTPALALATYVHVLDNIDDEDLDPTWSVPGYADYLITGRVATYRGVNLFSPIHISDSTSMDSNAAVAAPAITTTVNECKIIYIWAATGIADIGYLDLPTFVEVTTLSNDGFTVAMAQEQQGLAGLTYARIATVPLGADVGMTIALRKIQ